MENKEKLFVIGLAAFSVLMGFALVIMLFFVTVPEGNKTLIDVAFGALITTGVVSIFNYYFGSSKGSSYKNEMLERK